MHRRAVRIPDDAMAYAKRGDKIAAIKALREHTGLNLQQAREAIEAYLADPRRDATVVPAHEPLQSQPIPRRAIVALENGRLVEAVKHVRDATGAGLKDAKEHLERHLADNPALPNADAWPRRSRALRAYWARLRWHTCMRQARFISALQAPPCAHSNTRSGLVPDRPHQAFATRRNP